jgi:SAM-dependent methyltransferase
VLNWLLRYKPVIEMIDDLQATEILDVGSGRHGLTWYANRKVVQTDLDFPTVEDDTTRVGSAEFVAARAEALPFAANAFDVVIALDLVEHLPEAIREPALKEMCRVARRAVIVGYPDGPDARRLDRFLAKVWRIRSRRELPAWLSEHLDQDVYPDRAMLESGIAADWAVTQERRSGNLFWQGLIVSLEWTPLNRLLLLLEARLRTRRVPAILIRGRTYRTIWVVSPSRDHSKV